MTLDDLLRRFDVHSLNEGEKASFNRVWHRLRPWPDSVAGLYRMRPRFTLTRPRDLEEPLGSLGPGLWPDRRLTTSSTSSKHALVHTFDRRVALVTRGTYPDAFTE
jgi:hypothetical protein